MDLSVERKRETRLTDSPKSNISKFMEFKGLNNQQSLKKDRSHTCIVNLAQLLTLCDERKKSLKTPKYGVRRPGSISLVGVHFSKEERSGLSGFHYGEGMRGAERIRFQRDSADLQGRYRIHFYADEGSGIRPESGVGDYAHVTLLNNIYNWKDDPLKLWEEASKHYKDPVDLVNYVESAIIRNGFDGVYAPKALGSQGVIVLLGDRHTDVPVLFVGKKHGSSFYQRVLDSSGCEEDIPK
jgi:hypothetical protein